MLLDFKDYESWFSKIEIIANKYIDDETFKELNKLEYSVEIYNIVDAVGKDIVVDVENYIKSNFNYIALYHATATDNINSYLEKGLIPLKSEGIIDYARNIFNQTDFPEVTNEIFTKAINNVIINDENFKEQRENIVCFSVDDELLLESHSSHYLLYGGETLLHIAQNIGHSYPKVLENKFTPTLLKCRVPFNLLEIDIIKSISEALIVRYFEKNLYPNDNLYPINITPYITKKLDPEYIMNYTNPKNIKCDVKSMCAYY